MKIEEKKTLNNHCWRTGFGRTLVWVVFSLLGVRFLFWASQANWQIGPRQIGPLPDPIRQNPICCQKNSVAKFSQQKISGANLPKLWDYHISRFWVGQWLNVSVICSPGTPQNEELCPNDQQWGHTGSKITITGIIIGEIVYKIFVMSWLLTCFVIGPWFLLQCFMHQNWIGMVQ